MQMPKMPFKGKAQGISEMKDAGDKGKGKMPGSKKALRKNAMRKMLGAM